MDLESWPVAGPNAPGASRAVRPKGSKHRLKGDRNADGAGKVFCGRVRVRFWCVRGNRTRTRAAVCVSHSPSATADLQSIESKHYTSNEGDARLPECTPNALAVVLAA